MKLCVNTFSLAYIVSYKKKNPISLRASQYIRIKENNPFQMEKDAMKGGLFEFPWLFSSGHAYFIVINSTNNLLFLWQ